MCVCVCWRGSADCSSNKSSDAGVAVDVCSVTNLERHGHWIFSLGAVFVINFDTYINEMKWKWNTSETEEALVMLNELMLIYYFLSLYFLCNVSLFPFRPHN